MQTYVSEKLKHFYARRRQIKTLYKGHVLYFTQYVTTLHSGWTVYVEYKGKKTGQNWQNYIPKQTKTTSKSATCLLCEEAYMYEWTLFWLH